MATEKQANLAREKNLHYLDKLGAHSIAVDEIIQNGKKTFAVIAYTEKKSGKTASHLEVEQGNKTVKVPLVVTVEDKFKLE